jgi:hypothetical protein
MEGLAFAAGLLLAVLGPLLLLLPVWGMSLLLGRWRVPQRLGVPEAGAGLVRWALAASLIGALVLASYLPGRLEFDRLCQTLAEPRIHERAVAEGFYLDDLTAGSFGRRYVGEEGFAWIETRDIYRRDAHVRYRRAGAEVVREPAPELRARHVVKSGVDVRERGIHVARTEITDREDGRLLAEAHSVTYHGGPLGFLLGVYGLSQCPDPRTAEGSRQFDTYYHIARRVLRPQD